MQAASLPVSAGWLWIRDGYRLFMRQPAALFFWSLLMGVLITASYLLPILGQIALIGATPLLTFIILSACRRVASGQRMGWGLWLQPLRGRGALRRRLLLLGGLYLILCLAAGLVSTLPFLNELAQAIDTAGHIDEALLLAAMRGPFISFSLLYLLISALFWHAPALTGWHAIPITQALFYSMVACWRNKLPFLAYGISWAAIFFSLHMLGNLLLMAGLSFASLQFLMMPANLVLAAVLYCSFYPAYLSVFGANEASAD